MTIKWDNQGNDKFNSKDYTQYLHDLSKQDGAIDKDEGDFDKAYSEAPVKLDAFYETPVVSHSPIEPMNCVAKLDRWQ